MRNASQHGKWLHFGKESFWDAWLLWGFSHFHSKLISIFHIRWKILETIFLEWSCFQNQMSLFSTHFLQEHIFCSLNFLVAKQLYKHRCVYACLCVCPRFCPRFFIKLSKPLLRPGYCTLEQGKGKGWWCVQCCSAWPKPIGPSGVHSLLGTKFPIIIWKIHTQTK